MRVLLKAFFRVIAEIVYRPRMYNRQNLPKSGPAILCPNHVHALDSVIIVLLNKRKVNVLAKEVFFKNIFFRFFAKKFGIYPVKPENKSMTTMKISLKILKNNELLMIFPEGTRNGMKKGVEPKDGAIKLAISANVPVIPIGVQGNFKIFRRVKINIGEPITYSDYKDKIKNPEILKELTKDLMKKIVALRDDIEY